LIDCRKSKKAYQKSHLNTAIYFEDILDETVYLSPPQDNYSIVVFYDEDGSYLTSNSTASKNTSYQLINTKGKNSNSDLSTSGNLKQRSNSINQNLMTKSSDELIALLRAKIQCNPNKSIYILSGGFEQFVNKFPFMSTSADIRSTVDRHKFLTIYPSCVIENQIYIGTGVQAKNWKIIRDLGITHIINASIEHECVFESEISYLHLKIEDSFTENIYPTLVKGVEFIQNVLRKYQHDLKREEDEENYYEDESLSKRLSSLTTMQSDETSLSESTKTRRRRSPKFFIHCNLGISRSSSILIAFLIVQFKMCLYSAFNFVQDKRLQIAPNYNFLKQLKQFEKNNF
jgi:hypothetical protein